MCSASPTTTRLSVRQVARRLPLALVAAALLGPFVGSCSSQVDREVVAETRGEAPSNPLPKEGTGKLRNDLEPLTTRFEAVGSASSAQWMSGNAGSAGDDRVPGSTPVWLDAVVTLDADTAEMMRTDFDATITDRVPDVVDGLVGSLPAGPLMTSDELSRHTDGDGLGGPAFIAVDSDVLIITKFDGD